jgi:DNA repair exonuclease SbcCD ATPase subunit
VYTKEPVNQEQNEKEQLVTSKNETEMIKKECEILKLNQDNILSLHNMYKQEALLNDDNTFSTSIWKPEKMEFKNLFGFNKSKVHNVNFQNGIHSIQAANGVGKTSLINALLFGIYGKTPLVPFGRGLTYDIINNCETEGYVNIYFLFNNVRYIIKRYNKKTRQRSNNFINSKLQSYTFYVDLYKCGSSYTENMEKVSETGNATDEIILKMFGDIEYFLHSNMLDKESSKDIATATTQTDRLRILKKIFHLEYYDDYKQLNAKNIKNVKAQRDARINEIKGVETMYHEEEETYLQQKLKEETQELQTTNQTLQELEEQQQIYTNKLNDTNNAIELNLIKLKDAPKVTATKEQHQKISKELRAMKEPSQQPNSVDWYNSQISSLLALNSEYSKHILPEEDYQNIPCLQEAAKEKEHLLDEPSVEIDEVKEEYYSLKTEFKNTKKSYEKYKIMNQIENDLSHEEVESEIKQVTSQRNAILVKNTSARSRKQLETELYYLHEQAKNYTITIDDEPKVKEAIEALKVEIELLKRETTNVKDEGISLVNLEKIKSRLESKLSALPYVENIPTTIRKYL